MGSVKLVLDPIAIAVLTIGFLLGVLFVVPSLLPFLTNTTCRTEVVFESDSGVNYDFRVKPRKILVCE